MSKVLVLGDMGLDIYHVGRVRGMSAEVPIPILDQTDQFELPAMAGNVVQNLQSLGVDVGAIITSHFPKKHRLMTVDGVQLARWDEEDYCLPYEGEVDLPPDTEVIVVAGYGKGSLPIGVVETIVASGLFLLVDTKSTPAPFLPASDRIVLFPNRVEYEKYAEEYSWFPCVIVKCGKDGVEIRSYGEVVYSNYSFSSHPICVNGAGDTFLAGFVAGLCRTSDFPLHPIMCALAASANVVEQPFFQRTTTMEAVDARLKEAGVLRYEEYAAAPPPDHAPPQFGGVDALLSEDVLTQ